ncbi:MAG: glycosyltransferase [Verrucomicrobia bacterium]|nr:glycosyltransferase [Verrucomicrobiota bacterium]
MNPALSVILCTHNPRPDYLSRTLDALKRQSLAVEQWELLLIDNASRDRLEPGLLAWHPHGRVLHEAELGLTPARLRGIAEATADLLVWVDDDNLLAPDYLAEAERISSAWPALGAWGCGHFEPEWEAKPSADLTPFLAYLAVHRAARDRWSNRLFDYEATPAGAGMCVRAAIARRYASQVRDDPRRKLLGRTGQSLSACEDFDLAFCAIDAGLGTGVFTTLRLTHLMPAGRVDPAYLERLAEGHGFASTLIHAWRGGARAPRTGLLARLREQRFLRALSPVERRVRLALKRGETRAWRTLAEMERTLPPGS